MKLFFVFCSIFFLSIDSLALKKNTIQDISHMDGPVMRKKPLDKDLQEFVHKTMQLQLKPYANTVDAATIVLHNHTGKLLSYIPALNYDNTQKPERELYRKALSSIEPLLWALAIEENILHKESLDTKNPFLKKKNSLERLSLYLGSKRISQYMKRMGFQSLNVDFTHPGALYRTNVSLWELSNAYRSLANGGLYSHINTEGKNLKEKWRVLPLGISLSIMDTLSTRSKQFKSLNSSLFSKIFPSQEKYPDFWIALKRSTSKNMQDNWCIGFSKNHTVGVWMGKSPDTQIAHTNDETEDLGEKAYSLWLRILEKLEQKTSLERKTLLSTWKDKTDQRNIFLQKDFSFKNNTTWQRILYPKHGMLLHLDDAEKKHSLRLQAHPPSKELWLAINGSVIGSTNKELLWKLQTGKHILTLNDQHDNVIDKVHFEVR